MIKVLLREIYYFFYDLLIILRNLRNDKNFIIILPRFFSKLIKKVFIIDKIKKELFVQNIRDKYDILTVFEIFAEEDYSLKKIKNWHNIKKSYDEIINNNIAPLIIDCGSNIGCSSEYFYRLFNKAHILMVEPNLKSLDFSKKNISFSKFELLNCAVSSENKLLSLDVSSHDNRSSRVSKNGQIKIESITINDLVLKNKNNCEPFVIKIDIEGFESDLFKKNCEWIELFEIIIIELHDWMLPGESNSFNFLNSLVETMRKNSKRDLLISGENLILIKNNDK